MSRTISPFASGTVLDSEQGGLGLNADELPAGLVLQTTGSGLAAVAPATGGAAKAAVNLATATTLPAFTYDNGVAGVGATITANANGALNVDGVAVTADMRILVTAETFENGIYSVTQAGSAGAPYILTRATDADTAAKLAGCSVPVVNGVEFVGTVNLLYTTGDIDIGTTALTFAGIAIDRNDIAWGFDLTPAGGGVITSTKTGTHSTLGNNTLFNADYVVTAIAAPLGALTIDTLAPRASGAAVAVYASGLAVGAPDVIQAYINAAGLITIQGRSANAPVNLAPFVQIGTVIRLSGVLFFAP